MKVFVSFAAALLTTFVASTSAYASTEFGRREALRSFAGSAGAAAAAFVAVSNPTAVQAIEACPKGSNNCLRTTWTPPSGTSANVAATSLEKIIKSYPQEGQSKVDLGGWTVVEDSFGPGKTASLEYKSGLGNFAKFFNGGKPFVDDLKLEIGSDGIVNVRSSSRVGDSDLGVNQKRLNFFVAKLREEGWTAPDPTY